ncbi:non-ribosomal peptide synthase/polyketide synthase [Fulvivirga ligni]|uniref:non-ribosomal peptide synthase/polyketide synthase n=1 Tax=Fulvivirga ligni TaxID=2904246 RepID=UPI001F2EDEEB|nr:non-ribosomal peptide synthase/polyketide synthase [Fulvivirga ligni]UII23765.1 non-ribosomal peptide synthase/polyketide synthase [Fulvivirga ligni]
MTIDEYITELRQRDIIVQVRDNQLEVKASKELLTPQVVGELREKKDEILDFFLKVNNRKISDPILPAAPQPYYALSAAQHRMYFLYAYERGAVAYNMPHIQRLGASLDADQLRYALKELVVRHEILRTSFEEYEDDVVQVIHSGLDFEIEEYSCTEEGVSTAVDNFIRPFKLEFSSFRAGLINVDNGDYILLMDMHHIISDGVSDGILLDDLVKLYRGESLSPVRLHYKDYSEWQQNESQQTLLSKQKSFWLNTYSDLVSPLELPLDYERPEEMNYDGGFQKYTLSKKLSSGLRLQSQETGHTLFMTFLSIFNIFLAKVCNQEDIVVGTPVAGRQHPDLEDVVGLFVNTLPLRNHATGTLSFQSFLKSVKSRVLQSFENQGYPYEELVDVLHIPRSVNRNPLFDVLFNYQNLEGHTVDFDGLDIIGQEASSHIISKFDLSLSVSDVGDCFQMEFEYKSSLFSPSTIDRFMGYLERIISSVLSEPGILLQDIDILSSREREELLDDFSGQEFSHPIDKTVLDFFKSQVSQTPDNIALIYEDIQLSYKELDDRTNQLANYLIERKGVNIEDVVGIYLRRSEEIVIAMLGILKSGGSYVPIDNEYTNERVNKIIKESGAGCIITDIEVEMLEGLDVIYIKEDPIISESPSTAPNVSISSSSLAYIIYTSGSTGVPNGVLISHNSLLDYSLTFKEYFSITAADRVIQQSSIAFDTIVEEVFPALLSGASIIVMPNGGRDIDYLKNSIQNHGANVLSTTPLVLSELNTSAAELQNLRLIISGGDVLIPTYIDRLMNFFPVYNTYGPSEATVCITYNRINKLSDTSLIGRPVYNHRVYIVDKYGKLCVRGSVGELCVSGPGLARGYLNNPSLTQDKFVDNPYGSVGDRMYRTGDLARWGSDGVLEFMGRVDDQVKVRGYRIEPGEIEHQLLLHPSIDSAVVVAQGESEKYLVAYYVCSSDVSSSDLRGHLQSVLPDYMVPPHYVHLSHLPLTSSGKVNKRALPIPDLTEGSDYEGASTALESQLVEVWSEVLKLPAADISVTRSFFELGGHSLRATVMVNKLAKVLEVSVPLQSVFRYQDIRSLSRYISGLGVTSYEPIPIASEKASYSLSPSQQRMYFLYEYDRSSVAYNMPRVLRLGSTINLDQLKLAIHGLVLRHEILRTSFEEDEEVVFQRVQSGEDFALETYRGKECEIDSIVSDFVRPFNLSESPFRAGLIILEEGGYILLMDMHHIVSDGVSDGILVDDFVQLYSGNDLPEVRLHYKDYAEWQQSDSQQSLLESQRTYWLEVYSDSVSPLELPLDYSRPEEMSYAGGLRSYRLSEDLSIGLRKLSEGSEATMFMTFLSLLNIFLSKLCNQSDIVVGTPVAGRHHADLEDVVGLFVNTLPLRHHVEGSGSFRSFLEHVKSVSLSGFAHQVYPYEELVDILHIPRSVNRNPLFDVMYSYHNQESSSDVQGDLDVSLYEGSSSRIISKFDLNFSIVDQGAQFEINLIYKTSLFSPSTIDRFMGYIDRIITTVIPNPDILLNDIDILSALERDKLLEDSRGEEVDYSSEKTVLDLFEEQVSLTPDHISLVYHDQELTYRELDARSNQLANYLIRRGITCGDIVCILSEPSFDFVIGILGILKCGAAFLSIAPDYPYERINYILKDSQYRLLLTQSKFSLKIPSLEKYINLDDPSSYDLSDDPSQMFPAAKDLAYVIYTSGSTGNPKGVMIEHSSLMNLCNWHNLHFNVSSSDRATKYAGIGFDASIWEIFPYLILGASIHIIDTSIKYDVHQLNNYFNANNITISFLPTQLCEQFLTLTNHSLRVLLTGGDKLRVVHKNDYKLYNNYGPTENTVVTTCFEIDDDSLALGNIPIGRPVYNHRVYIVDKYGKLCVRGSVGELCVSGPGLARGYLNNPSLTQDKFVDNPYGSVGDRMYRTGDLARWRSDGVLEFMGRVDDQVKVRGYRIEPGEIEHQLLLHPSIDSAVVVAQGESEKYLVAYYVCSSDVSSSDLRGHLQSVLPDYMVPPHYVHLSHLPLTSSGKVNKRALPIPDLTEGSDYEGASTALESQLVEVWSEVLKLPAADISVTRSFFELGGHSLRATVMVNKLAKVLEVSVPLQSVFRYQDIRSLSRYISGLGVTSYEPIPIASEKASYSLSPSQQRMYFLYEYDRSSVAYNMPRVLRLGSTINLDQLKLAIHGLVLRHEILRTSFEEDEEVVFQRVQSGEDFALETYRGKECEIDSIVSDFVRPFNLSESPFRAGLIILEEGGYILLMDMHHIVSDGVSDSILVDDFVQLYSGNDLPEVRLHYKDYAEWQQSDSQQSLLESQRTYWLEVYSDSVSPLELPLDYSRPEEMSYAGGLRSYRLSEDLSIGLRKLSEGSEATMFMTFLSLLNIFLSKLCNQSDIVVGTPVAGRHHADLEDVVGLFVNTLPLRHHVEGSGSFRSFLEHVKSVSLSGFAHQVYPYEELVDILHIPRSVNRNPLFDVMYSYHNQESSSDVQGDLDVSLYEGSSSRIISKFDLNFSIVDQGAQFEINLIYKTSLFSPSTIDRFMGYIDRIITTVIPNPDILLNDIDILSALERDKLLEDSRGEEVDYSSEKTVLDLFEEQVSLTPDHISLVYHDQELTYRELDARSNQLANYLIEVQGVSRGDIIGLMVDRCPELIIGMLGILKSGCTYLPVDISQPELRILNQLAESGSVLLLTGSTDTWSGSSIPLLNINDRSILNSSISAPCVRISVTDTVYIIYTSGSTGTPKGVMIGHEGIVNLIAHQKRYFGISDDERILQFSTIIFDASVEQIWLALLSGSSLVLIGKDDISESDRFKSYLITHGVTHLHATPSFLESIDIGEVPTLRRVVSGGEACKRDLYNRYKGRYLFYNKYGPTETTVTSIEYHATDSSSIRSELPIGKPIQNTQAYVLGLNLEVLPKGAIGELYLGGKGLAQGYLNNPSLTQDKFVDNPYGSVGDRMYRTGDLARWGSDGVLEFMGRVDDQVKVRGYRIEPGEIEHQLLLHPSIDSAVVVAQGESEKYLVAYYVCSSDVSSSDLRGHLQSVLPDYMVPPHYVHLSHLPLTSSGKVNKRALPIPDLTEGSDYEGASTALESQLVEVWSEVLKLPAADISVTRSFFELGGHSLRATVMVNKLAKVLEVSVPLQSVFRYQDIRSLSRYISGLGVTSYEPIPIASEKASYSLSPSQQRMYFLYEYDRSSVAYNMPRVLRLGSTINLDQLKLAIHGLVLRHEILRTSFEEDEEVVFQRVQSGEDFALETYRGKECEIDSIVSDFVRPFNLSESPFRAGLIILEEGGYILLMDMHHIVSDGVSDSILVDDFVQLYSGNDLPEVRLHYKDYAEWQQSDSQQSLLESQRTYWLEVYSDSVSPLELPLDYSRPEEMSYAGGLRSYILSEDLSIGLRKLSEGSEATMFMTFLSLLNIFLSKLCNQSDIVVGTPVAGRHHADLEDVVGLFVNTLPLRHHVEGSGSFRSFLEHVKSVSLSGFAHQVYPYEELVDILHIPRSVNRNPLFDVMYSYHNQESSSDVQGDLDVSLYEGSSSHIISKFDLSLSVSDVGDCFQMEFEYKSSLFSPSTIDRFMGYLERIISSVLSEPGILLQDIDILSSREREELLDDFSGQEFSHPIDKTVLDFFKSQVSQTPDNIALIYEDIQLSYKELDDRTNQLANYLIERKGVNIEDVVGIYLRRSEEIVIAMLGILKSGGSYVPIDNEYTNERVNKIIKESGAGCIITDIEVEMLEGLDVIYIKEDPIISESPSTAPNVSISSSSLAYIIYTSGSTGVPNGVLISHNSLLDYSLTFKEYFSITAADRVIQQSSIAFDTIVEEVFPALLSGASIIVMPNGGRDIDYLKNSIQNHGANVLSTTPLVLSELNTSAAELQNLRLIISGGDVLIPTYIDRLMNFFPVYNTYGPSEATVCITYNRINKLSDTSLIGRPVYNHRVYIVDKYGKLCVRGSVGELCVSGPGLARGYLNNPSLTQDKFVDNPYGSVGDRMYRTGDLARWGSDGVLEFMGRVDDQVKVRGYRIEPGEIEHQLLLHPSIDSAVVVAQGESEKYLVAYYVCSSDVSSSDLRGHLQSVLPDYMVPPHYVHLSHLPLTSSGKVNKRALPIPDLTEGSDYEGASTALESQLVEVWSEVLKLPAADISVTRSFFELGGHSLRATVMVNKLAKVLEVSVPLQSVFRYQDIRSLGRYISGLGVTSYEPIPIASEKASYSLSPSQQRMYFLYEYDRSSVAYNMPRVLRLGSTINLDQLKLAIHGLVLRHEILRTSFEEDEEVVFQRVQSGEDFALETYKGKECEIDSIVSDFVRPFNLSESPFRAGLIILEEGGYILLMDMHHIVSDGVSDGILVDDFVQLYSGNDLPEVRLHYKDYAEWQQSDSQQSLLESQRTYWLEVYSDSVSPLELPLDYSRPEEMSYAGGLRSYRLSEDLSIGLRKLSEGSEATMFMTFLSLLNIFLSKLCNQSDIVVGTPVAGRHHADLEDVVGLFVNTLPLRHHVEGSGSFRSFLEHVKSVSLSGFAHQVYPYEELVDILHIPRSVNRNPLFDVMYSYHNQESSSDVQGDLDVSLYEGSSSRIISKFDLNFSIVDQGAQFEINLIYKTSLFSPSTIDRFMGYIDRIITTVIPNPDILLNDIDILSALERDKLLEDSRGEEVDYSSEKTVLDLFEEQVSLTPDHISLVYHDQELTYRELDARSNQLANYLIEVQGVSRGDIIGLMVDRCPELIIGMLGILKSGCTYLPVDISQPELRILNQLAESGSVLLLTDSTGTWSGSSIPLLNINDRSILNSSVNAPCVRISVTDTVYIIYTSGSTGTPKGVMIGHEGIVNLIAHQQKYFGISDDERILQFSTIIFDASVEQIWLALLSGSSLVLIGKDDISESDRFKSYLITHGVTHLHATPSFLESIDIGEVPTLRRVVSGGEACKRDLYNRYKGRYLFYNEYGPTETTVTSIEYHATDSSSIRSELPIGKPIQNTQAYVLGLNLEVLPKGAIGELYLGGKGLAQGYLNNPSLTQDKFVDNPYGSVGDRMYRTGDLARWRSDGVLEFMGRVDDQVKVRGYRIEPGEIEHQLLLHPSIDSAVVVAQGESEKYLVAYYVCSSDVSSSDLRGHLQSVLPDYMVPPHYVHLSHLPLTSSGKVNKRALPIPDLTEGSDYEGASTALESQLVEVWSEVLKLPAADISVTRSFFELGGHSLRATVMVNKLAKVLEVSVPLQSVFRYQDIRSLGRYISGLGVTSYEPIPIASEKASYSLSPSQQRMYFLYEYDRSSVAYNMPRVLRLGSTINLDQLKLAIHGLVLRHEILRTSFEEDEEVVFQRVQSGEDFALETYKGKECEIDSIVSDFVRPFNLSESPFRAGLIILEEGGYILLMDMHHIVSDGVSDGILVDDFVQLYSGNDLPEVRLHYKDYAEWQQSDSQQSLLESQRTYWLEVYSDSVSPLELPLDYSRPEEMSYAGGLRSYILSEDLSIGLRKLSEGSEATMFMTFLSLLNIFLSKLCNQSDIVVGTPVAGRHHADLEDVVGLFVNTLPLRHHVEGSGSFRSFLEHVKSVSLSGFAHQVYPYEELVDILHIPRSVNRNPLFDVMYSYHNQESSSDVQGDLDVSLYEGSSSRIISKFDLNFSIVDQGAQFEINLIYKTSLFSPSTIDRFMGYIDRIITTVIPNPDILLSDIDILSALERDKLLEDSRGEEVDYSSEKTVLDLFEEQVSLTPDHISLVYHDQELTYRELDARSNQLANYLIEVQGVSRGDIIGLMVDRCPELIIGMLGILKSGCTYLPVDISQPELRILNQLAESGSVLLLTDSTGTWSGSSIPLLNINDRSILNSSVNAPCVRISVTDTVYIIYTSGSTGTPKGVMIGHEGIVNLIAHQQKYFGISDDERILQFSTIIFDASVEQIWLALLSGSSLVLIGKDDISESDRFKSYLITHGVTHLHATPSFLESIDIGEVPTLRRVVSGGEACKRDLYNRYKGRYLFYNEYGPTETTVTSIEYHATDSSSIRSELPIGKPIQNTQAYVLGLNLEVLPKGAIGELYLGGKGLAQGYLNNPSLTQDKFVDNPYGSVGDRMYRTGDLARWRSDGVLEFMGRVDDQVKVRGYRIEPGEIEHQLLLHPSIDSAVVVAQGESEKYLVAYYVCSSDVSSSDLRGHLQSVLPDYMVPPHYVHLSHLPLTSSGKVNKRALPIPDLTEGSDYEGASTALESQLVEVWSEVLKLPAADISVTRSFFELGGNSINAMKLISKIKNVLKENVALKDIFHYQTIRSLSENIENIQSEENLVIRLNEIKQEHRSAFFVPPIVGSSTIFKSLALLLNEHFNAYGFQYKGFDYDESFSRSIEEMAQTYVTLIEKVKPDRNISLIGYSMGAIVAFEMTKLLEDLGYNVVLVLLDRYPYQEIEHVSDQSLEKIVKNELRDWLHDLENSQLERLENLIKNNIRIQDGYSVSGKIKGKIIAVEAKGNSNQGRMREWRDLSEGGFDHHFIDADHYSVLREENLIKISNLILREISQYA